MASAGTGIAPTEATNVLTRHQWREGDLLRLEGVVGKDQTTFCPIAYKQHDVAQMPHGACNGLTVYVDEIINQ